MSGFDTYIRRRVPLTQALTLCNQEQFYRPAVHTATHCGVAGLMVRKFFSSCLIHQPRTKALMIRPFADASASPRPGASEPLLSAISSGSALCLRVSFASPKHQLASPTTCGSTNYKSLLHCRLLRGETTAGSKVVGVRSGCAWVRSICLGLPNLANHAIRCMFRH